FQSMKLGSRFYNLGRGGTVDTDALVDALRSGHLAAAGLDVTEPEPLPADSPLWDMEQVIITAHTSGATPKLWGRIVDLTVDNLRRWDAGKPLRNQVDLTLGY
ncbi:MAG: NAD(P)-dependent oxidoreductase, partial [Chloroflexota bacterium]